MKSSILNITVAILLIIAVIAVVMAAFQMTSRTRFASRQGEQMFKYLFDPCLPTTSQ